MASTTGVPEFCTARPIASERAFLLPGATAPIASERSVAVIDTSVEASRDRLSALGLSWHEAGEPVEGLYWQRDLPRPEHFVFEETGRLWPAPIGLEGSFEVVATDGADRPVIVRVDQAGAIVLLLLDASLVSNATMGKERERPTSVEAIGAHQLAFQLLGWLWQGFDEHPQ